MTLGRMTISVINLIKMALGRITLITISKWLASCYNSITGRKMPSSWMSIMMRIKHGWENDNHLNNSRENDNQNDNQKNNNQENDSLENESH